MNISFLKPFPTVILAAGLLLTTAACSTSKPAPKALPGPAAKAIQSEPDYSAWSAILSRYYDPATGMNYRELKMNESGNLQKLRSDWARVDVKSLSKDERKAFWINLYNLNTTAIVVEKYPVKSIRDLSTDLIKRLNVFDKELVPFGTGMISLNQIENQELREGFHDPRIHFAINCAARSCPPMRKEAFTGAKISSQLDEQTRSFLNSEKGMKFSGSSVRVTRVMDFFKTDFETWGGGSLNFLRKYANAENRKQLDGDVKIVYDKYDWALNDRN